MNSTLTQTFSIRVWTYVPPIIIFAGTLGHVMTIIAVLHRRATSFTVYLAALAIVDTLVLNTNTLCLWFQYAFGIVIKEQGQIWCKLFYFFGFLFIHLSSWLVVCLTIERTLCLYFPYKFGQIPAPRIGLIVVGSVTVFLCALDGHTLYGRGFVTVHNHTECGFVDINYTHFFYKYWNKIHFIVYFLLPIVIIILGNSAILINVYKSSKKAMTVNYILIKRRTRHVFIMTFLLSVSFVVLVSPFPVLFTIAPVNVLEPIATMFFQLLYLNHAVNFYLYVLSGRRFREDLKSAIRKLRCRQSEVVTTVSTTRF